MARPSSKVLVINEPLIVRELLKDLNAAARSLENPFGLSFNRGFAGRISCDQIVPYPPGIPVLIPGQRITDDIVEYLVRYLRVQNKVELHGVVYQGYVPSIRVLSAEEERYLVALAAARPPRRRSA